MHELSIAVGIVDAVLAETELRGLDSVTCGYVRLGALSGVDHDALQFSFPMACEGTALAGARLEIENVPVLISCDVCGADAPAAPQQQECPRCGASATRIVQGREIELRAFEAAEGVHP